MGHGLGASSMGGLAYLAKQAFGGGNSDSLTGTSVDTVSEWMELAVGVTLVIIGVMGLRKSGSGGGLPASLRAKKDRDLDLEGGGSSSSWPRTGSNSSSSSTPDPFDAERHFSPHKSWHHPGISDHDDAHPHHDHNHNHGHGSGHSHDYSTMGPRAMLLTGIVHGFSGTGHLLGVIPALLLSPALSVCYLVAFCIGTCVAMAVFTGAIGEVTFALGRNLHRPDLPQVLARYSSIVALVVGVCWIITGAATVLGWA